MVILAEILSQFWGPQAQKQFPWTEIEVSGRLPTKAGGETPRLVATSLPSGRSSRLHVSPLLCVSVSLCLPLSGDKHLGPISISTWIPFVGLFFSLTVYLLQPLLLMLNVSFSVIRFLK